MGIKNELKYDDISNLFVSIMGTPSWGYNPWCYKTVLHSFVFLSMALVSERISNELTNEYSFTHSLKHTLPLGYMHTITRRINGFFSPFQQYKMNMKTTQYFFRIKGRKKEIKYCISVG